MARYRLSAGLDYRKTENSFKQEQFASRDEIACLLNIIYQGCYLPPSPSVQQLDRITLCQHTFHKHGAIHAGKRIMCLGDHA